MEGLSGFHWGGVEGGTVVCKISIWGLGRICGQSFGVAESV